MIKAVIMDVDNTLLDFNLSAKETIKSAFTALDIEYTDEVFDEFLRVNDLLWRKIEKKEITRAELHRDRWNIIFDGLKIRADGAKMERLFLDNLENHAIPVSGALETVKYLAAKYRLYTASNAPYYQQVKRLALSGIRPYVSEILNFEPQGINKPERRFFEACLNAIAPTKKEEVVLIGDSLSADMKGGKEVGFTTVWFNYYRLNVEPPAECDYAVKCLSEIKNIL